MLTQVGLQIKLKVCKYCYTCKYIKKCKPELQLTVMLNKLMKKNYVHLHNLQLGLMRQFIHFMYST